MLTIVNYLEVFKSKIGHLRMEIADIQELNQQFRRDGGSGIDAQVAHGQRSVRLQGIQHELAQLADFGRRVVPTEHDEGKASLPARPAKQKRAA
jgi:hypothetical protein